MPNLLLLDTHVLLWALKNSKKLKGAARKAIEDSSNVIYVSAVSSWELTIKESLGKLKAPDDLLSVLQKIRFLQLSVTIQHTLEIKQLPHLHQDPFDRLLIAQARVEKLTLVTHDEKIKQYDVEILAA